MLPYSAMFHLPTFNHRLYLNRVSPLLLDVIYAISSRLSENTTFISSFAAETPSYARGEILAERANQCARHTIDQRAVLSVDDKRLNPGTWEETEFAQALCLLCVYFTSTRQPGLASFYLDSAINILRPTPSATLSPPANNLGISTVEYLTLMEARHRTFWMIMMQDLSSPAEGKSRRIQDHEIYNIPLPSEEAHWARYGGGAVEGRETGRRDGMAAGTGSWGGEEGQIGEFGYVMRIVSTSSRFAGTMLIGFSSQCSRTSCWP